VKPESPPLVVPLDRLRPWSPFANCVWGDMTRALSLLEVQRALDHQRFIKTPLTPKRHHRWQHAGRVAYLSLTGWSDAIVVDVGVPSLGHHVGWLIQDGNHRLAAAFFRCDPTILVSASGEVKSILELFGVAP
jgi:hypothetical protein